VLNTVTKCRARAQVFSHRFPTTTAQVRAQVKSCGVCGGQSGTEAGFLRVLRFVLPILIQLSAPHSSSGAGIIGQMVADITGLGRILGFLERCRYFFFQVAPQLYSRGWVDPVPDPLLLRKSGGAGSRTRTSGSVARNFDHQITEAVSRK
jgi:hypothetical protein